MAQDEFLQVNEPLAIQNQCFGHHKLQIHFTQLTFQMYWYNLLNQATNKDVYIRRTAFDNSKLSKFSIIRRIILCWCLTLFDFLH